MKNVGCPHCGHKHNTSVSVPKDVVVVLPCPSCSEWIVLYRNKVLALSRQVIEQGSRDEKISHISQLIAEFLDSGAFPFLIDDSSRREEAPVRPIEQQRPVKRRRGPITQGELDRFVRLDLKRIDEATYFKKYFG